MQTRFSIMPFAAIAIAFAATTAVAVAAETPSAKDPLARGRYLVKITGCNDCHTPGYLASEGKVPESEWLKGDALGWKGPWGTTYPSNLRLYMKDMTEKQWLAAARSLKARPPMPVMNLAAMNDADLREIYRFIKSLKPVGEPAPAYLPPGTEAKGPVVTFPAPPPAPAKR
jgi:mono/diheme cytochrome c family protein